MKIAADTFSLYQSHRVDETYFAVKKQSLTKAPRSNNWLSSSTFMLQLLAYIVEVVNARNVFFVQCQPVALSQEADRKTLASAMWLIYIKLHNFASKRICTLGTFDDLTQLELLDLSSNHQEKFKKFQVKKNLV